MNFIIEKTAVISIGMSSVLKSHIPGSEVTVFETPEEAQLFGGTVWPRLIVVSLSAQSNKRNMVIVASLRKAFPSSKIVAYSSLEVLPDAIASYYHAGVSGFSSLADNDMDKCIKTVCENKTYFNSMVVDSFVFYLQLRHHRMLGSTFASRRECQVTYLLAKGMDIAMIAQKLNTTTSKIDTLKTRIFKKLAVGSIQQLQAKVNVSPEAQ